ncbi:MAG: divalent-cation tolerance protein CutA [Pseudomonadota bacterium]
MAPPLPDIRLVYSTAPDTETAQQLARMLVENRLAACVNVLGPISSVYRWQGEVVAEAEVAFLAKTTAQAVEALTERLVRDHPYECPCVVSLPVQGEEGHAPFLAWLAQEARP